MVLLPVIGDYSMRYETPESCQFVQEENDYNYYFDTSKMNCKKCQQKKEIQIVSSDGKVFFSFFFGGGWGKVKFYLQFTQRELLMML